MVQTLHLMNSPKICTAKSPAIKANPHSLPPVTNRTAKIIEELYLAVYSRFPTAEEYEVALGIFPPESSVGKIAAAAKNIAGRRQAAEDLLWAVINTPEFIFKD